MRRRQLFGRGRRPFEAEPRAEVEDELAFHLAQRADDYAARGLDADSARAAALERFGDLPGVRSECTRLLEADRRAEHRRDWFADLKQDLRFGVRGAIRAPLFSLLAVLTLALGIGANATVFGVVKSVLLNALPYANADRLVRVYARMVDGSMERSSLSAGTVMDLAERQRAFAATAMFTPFPEQLPYAAEQGPLVVSGAWVGGTFFRTLGVGAVAGRTIEERDVAPGAPAVTMLSYAAWQRLFAGQASVIGTTVRINGTAREVVGVLPRGFVGPMGATDIWNPLDISDILRDPVRMRRMHWLGFLGRLAPGATLETARRDVQRVASELEREHPADQRGITLTAEALRDTMVGDTRQPLLVLMASAALVLLITCANLAGAVLSRTIARRKEFAVRLAMGAGRGRLVRQLLTESVVLALAGGVAGLLLAVVGLSALRGLAASALPAHADLALDPIAIAFTIGLTLLAGVAFGLAPAMSIGRSQPQGALREESRGASEGRRARQLRGTLVAAQIALCVSLLAGAGLLVRSLLAMTSAPLGFDPNGVSVMTVNLPWRDYMEREKRIRLFETLEERLRALPGVERVGSTSELPSPNMNRNGLTIDGVTWPNDVGMPFITYSSVSPDYFSTMGIALRSGRTFGATDRVGTTTAIVISEAMARRYWPKGDAIGARIRMGPDTEAPWSEVIGIVADVRNDPTRAVAEPMAYGSSLQDAYGGRAFVLRATQDVSGLARQVQRELSALDPSLPLYDPTTLSAFLANGLAGRRLPVVLMTAFGALALVLASVGVYAMFATMAAAREREFGVRIALGSSRGAIAGLVLRQGGAWMALGLMGGAAGVVIVSRLLSGLLYEVSPFDPIALLATTVLLVACGAVALLVPVRRATRVDPIGVLR